MCVNVTRRTAIIKDMQGRETGVAIIVWRRAAGNLETLVLHRSLFPPDYSGDWAWATPGGGREVGESARGAATRELREETGLAVECRAVTSTVAAGLADIDVFVFEAEAPADATIELSDEHDRFEWVRTSELSRCLPSWVSAMYREVLEQLPVEVLGRN